MSFQRFGDLPTLVNTSPCLHRSSEGGEVLGRSLDFPEDGESTREALGIGTTGTQRSGLGTTGHPLSSQGIPETEGGTVGGVFPLCAVSPLFRFGFGVRDVCGGQGRRHHRRRPTRVTGPGSTPWFPSPCPIRLDGDFSGTVLTNPSLPDPWCPKVQRRGGPLSSTTLSPSVRGRQRTRD